jgi:hypothetical protein
MSSCIEMCKVKSGELCFSNRCTFNAKELQEMAISECANREKVKALTSAITQSCAKYLQKENL